MRLENILQNSNYSLDLFTKESIERLETRVKPKEIKQRLVPYVTCLIREKEIKLTPEEIVRQLYLDKLINEYNYPKSRIQVEYSVHFGREIKRADIVILYDEKTQKDRLQKDRKARNEYIVIELKKPKMEDGIEQLKSYANFTGVSFASWCNGKLEIVYHRENPNVFKEIQHLPNANQSLEDIFNEGFKYIDLVQQDILVKEKASLKDKILLIEDDVLANTGENAFEEVFKLIFVKLYDELQTYRKDEDYIKEYNILSKKNKKGKFNKDLKKLRNKMHDLQFAIYEKDDDKLYVRIQELFTKAKGDKKWQGIFPQESKIALTPGHLAICVSNLQKCKFFNSNLEVIDDAFEYLANKDSKGEKGQYFTPRYVIDMCVKMLNPNQEESMIDTASGSCGFPIHTCFYVWKKIYKEQGRQENEILTAEKKIKEAIDYAKNNVFAIDFDPRTVRISKMLNLIAGDGHTNVFKLNSLDYVSWDRQKEIDEATKVFNKNFENLEKILSKERKIAKDIKDYSKFNFDIVMANPPFAGNIKEHAILREYTLRKNVNLKQIEEKEAKKYKTILENPTYDDYLDNPTAIIKTNEGYKKIKIKEQPVITRDILFIERNLNMLKPGGRMAIVLPQGRFNNSSDKHIREFIAKRARILAVVGLHGNVFKPHTGTKTSVLFLQKWGGIDEKGNELCPKIEDYNIFFATMNEPSKDNSGNKIYVENEYIILRQIKNKQIIKEVKYSVQEFESLYKNIESACFFQLEDKKIDQAQVKKLTIKEKQQIIQQEAFLLSEPLLDSHGHLIVKHDLYNHEGLTQDGIAEAFIEFAKAENLSFWRKND